MKQNNFKEALRRRLFFCAVLGAPRGAIFFSNNQCYSIARKYATANFTREVANMDFTTYVKPELAILIPMLYGLGLILKHTEKIKDNFIPVILTVVSMVLSCLYVLGTEGITATNIFAALVQGVICVAGAVYTNQLYKQSTK